MNERLLEAKKNAEKFKEYLQSDSKKEVRKFAEELIIHKDNIDFVSILEDALTLYDFIVWKKESVPAETLVMPKIAEVHKNAEIMADPKSSDAEIYLAACRIAQIRIDEMARIYTEQVQEEVNKLSNFSA